MASWQPIVCVQEMCHISDRIDLCSHRAVWEPDRRLSILRDRYWCLWVDTFECVWKFEFKELINSTDKKNLISRNLSQILHQIPVGHSSSQSGDLSPLESEFHCLIQFGCLGIIFQTIQWSQYSLGSTKSGIILNF